MPISPYSTKSNREKPPLFKNSPEKSFDLDKKNQEWQLRYAGMAKTIRGLEAQNKEKSEAIQFLEKELEERQKHIDILEGKLESDKNRSYIMQSTSLLGGPTISTQRTKEKELEKKIKELEGTIARNKKQIARVNEVNSQLLSKIKGNDDVLKAEKFNSDNLESKINEMSQNLKETQNENESYFFLIKIL